ncbi:hypothetical protein DCS_05360 [Drechmeria coniospora]|uniref:Uncharacterized protein n=1 Tax=Drechmeria coniospora TaxID=98403 RepID=A0A151GMK8_DRECN|nr:hypothetical protein DCS_05360 [Drechmeria coniospora]KYK58347.1 hypothetical protein DCS_05360 [Drechmeria coniospora]
MTSSLLLVTQFPSHRERRQLRPLHPSSFASVRHHVAIAFPAHRSLRGLGLAVHQTTSSRYSSVQLHARTPSSHVAVASVVMARQSYERAVPSTLRRRLVQERAALSHLGSPHRRGGRRAVIPMLKPRIECRATSDARRATVAANSPSAATTARRC